MKFSFIRDHQKEYRISTMCSAMEVSRSGYYAWVDRPPSAREKERTSIGFSLLNLHQASRERYGAPRLHRGLTNTGVKCSYNRVVSIMREFGIRSKIKKKHKATTNSNHKLPVAENLLNRDFAPKCPDKAWASDITYIPT